MVVLGTTLAVLPASVAAQTGAHVNTPDNLRQAPNGTVLGRLARGTPLNVVAQRGPWLQVRVDGWIWTRSLQRTDRDGFDLIVSASGGENLRAAPSGTVLGHFVQGALLHRVGSRPGWLHVKRQAFIWAASVSGAATSSGPTTPAHHASAPRVEASKATARAPDTVPPAGVASKPKGFIHVGRTGAPLLTSAGGDTMALARPGTELQVLSREGDWARVRLEGWAWLPAGDTAASAAAVDSALTPADVKKAPKAYRGRVVSWTLQFISLEYAEKVRTDFFEGEPYLLTRFGDNQGTFVYVAVPRDRLTEVQGLAPLDRITVTGRIRTGASALTGTPIIDLLTLKVLRRSR